MTEFAIYELKSAAVLFLFYLFYKLLLSKDTLHRLNRAILVTTAVISMVLPLVVITVKAEAVGNYGITPDVLTGNAASNASDSIPWANIVIFVGMAISLTATLISIVKTILLIRSGELVNESSGIRPVVLDRERFSSVCLISNILSNKVSLRRFSISIVLMYIISLNFRRDSP